MKKYFLTISFVLVTFFLSGQNNSKEYNDLIDKAESFRITKDFKNAAIAYFAAANMPGVNPVIDDWDPVACAWSLAGYPDSAFKILNTIANLNNLTFRAINDEILTDDDYIPLHNDKRWKEVIDKMFINAYKTFLSAQKEAGGELSTLHQNESTYALALGKNEDNAFVYLNDAAYVFLRKKQFEKAYRLFKVSIDNFPPNYTLYKNMLDYYKATGDKERAYIYFSRAEVVKYKKATIFSDNTLNIDSAIKSAYCDFSKNFGQEFRAPEYLISMIANELLKKGLTDKAYGLFKTNVDNNTNSFSAYKEMGNFFVKKGDSENAKKYFSKSMVLQYKLPERFFHPSFNVKEYIQNHYTDLLINKRDRVFFSETFFNSVGDYFLSNKLYDKAELLFLTSIEKYPQSMNAYSRMATFYKTTGDSSKELGFKKQAQTIKSSYQQKGIIGNEILHDSLYNLQVTKPICLVECPTVLLQNNGRWSWGTYKPFFNLMINDGYRMILNKHPLTQELLSKPDVVVIVGDRLDKVEIQNINNWVRSGGALLAITQHDEVWFDEFLQSLGVQNKEVVITSDSVHGLAPDGLSASFGYTVFSEKDKLLGIHPITRGRNDTERVRLVKTFGGGRSIIGPPGSSVLLSLSKTAVDYMTIDPDNPISSRVQVQTKLTRSFGTAFKLGKGRVVVISNAPSLTAALFPPSWTKIGMNNPGSDNKQFALNIMRWLTGYLK